MTGRPRQTHCKRGHPLADAHVTLTRTLYTWEDDGLLIFQSCVPESINRRIVADLALLRAGPCHELLQKVPAAAAVLNDPIVKQAVAVALGEGAAADLCRHVHESGDDDGPWHQDDYCGQPWPLSPRRVILCYFPQDTPEAMGPTEVRSLRGDEILVTGPAGTCLLMRHDLWHRATANRTLRRRFMLKFLFIEGR
ncbi:MAG: hypothetical protein AB7H90_00990 [Alphaproteobacteria bacterium]